MRTYEYIKKEWLLSPTARLVYQAAAGVSLTLIPVLVAVQFTYSIRPFLKQLLFLAVLGTALNLVGMENFLFRFDDSRPLKQVFWFCVMIFAPIGPALYCFIVYSRSNAFKSGLADRHDETPGAMHQPKGP